MYSSIRLRDAVICGGDQSDGNRREINHEPNSRFDRSSLIRRVILVPAAAPHDPGGLSAFVELRRAGIVRVLRREQDMAGRGDDTGNQEVRG